MLSPPHLGHWRRRGDEFNLAELYKYSWRISKLPFFFATLSNPLYPSLFLVVHRPISPEFVTAPPFATTPSSKN
jgi:hypothetical protein